MALDDVRILTFDVVGTLIDFETGILDCMRPTVRSSAAGIGDAELLAAFGRVAQRLGFRTCWIERRKDEVQERGVMTAPTIAVSRTVP